MTFSQPNKSYEIHRYERLMECIDEYMGGDGPEMGIDYLLRDLKKVSLDISTYHRKVYDDCTMFSDYLP
jgi:hypothetical protein